MIKLIQEERDMGTKEVQEVMQQVDVEIVSVIQSYLKIAIEKVKLANVIQKLQHIYYASLICILFLIGKNHEPLEKKNRRII